MNWNLPRPDDDGPLTALLARMERVMRFDSGAPGEIALLGALTDRSEFGIEHHGLEKMSFGGRGWREIDAVVTCMGEAAEHLSFHERDSDPLLLEAGQIDLKPNQLAWAEKLAGGFLQHRPRVLAQKFDGKPAYLPVDLMLRRPPQSRNSYRAAETTGLAAGATLPSALESALLEIIERDAVALWWWGGLPGQPLDIKFKAAPNRRVWCIDITSDIGIPVVVALSSSLGDDSIVLGFAAARTTVLAANRAYLELRQMEIALSLSFHKLQNEGPDALTSTDRATLDRALKLSLMNYPWLRGEGDVVKTKTSVLESQPLPRVLSAAGLDTYWIDLTRPDIQVPVIRALVPGLQPIKPGAETDRLANVTQLYPKARAVELPPPT